MTAALALLLTAAGTYAIRAGAVHLLPAHAVSPAVTAALHHAALAVMAVIAASNLPPSDRGGPAVDGLVAVGVTALAARRTRNIPALVAVGVAAGASVRLLS